MKILYSVYLTVVFLFCVASRSAVSLSNGLLFRVERKGKYKDKFAQIEVLICRSEISAVSDEFLTSVAISSCSAKIGKLTRNNVSGK